LAKRRVANIRPRRFGEAAPAHEVHTLYVVATPLGNLGDLTQRAADVLRAVDVVAAEDTRRTRTLLHHVGARPRVLSYHAHSPAGRAVELERLLQEGKDIALVTDAGTPTVSDPGSALVARARECGVTVCAVPGPSAVTAALSVSGFSADRYTFFGFVPRKGRGRRESLALVAQSLWTAVMFESANRLVRLLEDLATVCGSDREAAVVRELTKLNEEVRVGNLADLAGYYDEHVPRGEVTVIVGGGKTEPIPVSTEAVARHARELLATGLSRRDTAAALAREFSLPRREAYDVVTHL
jgi:16S rRNA (cytidine1402-2'-O)-methyltransferase